jgi:hypothetical protein
MYENKALPQPVSPIFIYPEDDPTYLRMHDDALTAASWYEEIDIEAGLYSGWDVTGRPLKLVMNPKPKVVLTDDKPRLEELRAAILSYGNSCDPQKPFVCPENTNDVVVLYEAAERHLEAIRAEHWNRSLLGRITRRFRRR